MSGFRLRLALFLGPIVGPGGVLTCLSLRAAPDEERSVLADLRLRVPALPPRPSWWPWWTPSSRSLPRSCRSRASRWRSTWRRVVFDKYGRASNAAGVATGAGLDPALVAAIALTLALSACLTATTWLAPAAPAVAPERTRAGATWWRRDRIADTPDAEDPARGGPAAGQGPGARRHRRGALPCRGSICTPHGAPRRATAARARARARGGAWLPGMFRALSRSADGDGAGAARDWGLAIYLLTALYGTVIGFGTCLPCQRFVEART